MTEMEETGENASFGHRRILRGICGSGGSRNARLIETNFLPGQRSVLSHARSVKRLSLRNRVHPQWVVGSHQLARQSAVIGSSTFA